MSGDSSLPKSKSRSSGRFRCSNRPLIVPFSVNSPAVTDGGTVTIIPATMRFALPVAVAA